MLFLENEPPHEHLVQFETDSVRIPLWVTDLGSFRRWAESEESPDKAIVCYLAGEVWVEMSKEQVYSHNHVKTEFASMFVKKRPSLK